MSFDPRPGFPRERDDPRTDPDPESDGRAIEFRPGPEPVCEAMQALSGKRLLAREAPLLPLPGCDQPLCGCRYRFLPERRTDVRRSDDAGFRKAQQRYGQDQPFLQRRSPTRGRRQSDD